MNNLLELKVTHEELDEIIEALSHEHARIEGEIQATEDRMCAENARQKLYTISGILGRYGIDC